MVEAKQSGVRSRFTDLSDEPVDHMLAPIGGYQDRPLVSLSKAVEPVAGFFDKIEDHIFVALNNCQNPAEELTQDESASIHLYTMQFDGGSSLYLLLNESLRAENRGELLPWFSFLKLFLTALHKLPSQSGTVWRGIKGVDLSSKYKTGTKFAWWGVSSCTTHVEVLEADEFLGKHGQRTLFSIECINGKSVAKHSYFKNTEKEIILMPGSYFEVMSQLSPAPGLYIIQLKEITPPITFVKPPFVKLNEPKSTPIAHQSSASSSSSSTTMKPVPSASSKISSKTKINIPANATWKQNGVTIAGGHGECDATNQLSYPYGLFVDDDQTVVIADCGNHRIMQWKNGDTTNGQVVAGRKGAGNGLHQLKRPIDVSIDKETNSLIICDQENRRVVRWSRRSGTTQGEILIDNIYCWGLAMDEQRYFYVSDREKLEVRRYRLGEKNGTLVAGGNGEGDGLNQLNWPASLFVDRDHSVYVSDTWNHRVMKWVEGAKEGIVIAGGQGKGNALTQLSSPTGLFVDTLGTLYVADTRNHRVMRWTQGDKKQGTVVVGGNGQGAEANQFSNPTGLSFGRHGNLYVADWKNHRVQRFSIE
ncbi:unnamed protein product [Rotaria socialis]